MSVFTVYSRLPEMALKISGLMTAVDTVGPVNDEMLINSFYKQKLQLTLIIIQEIMFLFKAGKRCVHDDIQ